jgi:hypothetical protein
MWSNTLSGTIPSTLQQLLGLRYLLLSDNQLSGTIPLHLGNLRALHWLTLHNNVLRYADSAGRRRNGVHLFVCATADPFDHWQALLISAGCSLASCLFLCVPPLGMWPW